jgi:inosine-uridine nucleoside N-ribohydrolase
VTTKIVITIKDLLKMRENNTIISNYCYRNLIFWNAINTLITGGGFFPHDILVPMFKIQPDLFKFKRLALKMDIKNIPGKISIIKDNIKARYIKMVCYDISKQLLIKKFLEILNR